MSGGYEQPLCRRRSAAACIAAVVRSRVGLWLRLAAYRRRNVVERCFHRLKQWRGIATRYDKRPDRYLAAITLASTLIWLDT